MHILLAYSYTEIVSGLEENPKNVIRGKFQPVQVYSDFLKYFLLMALCFFV